MPTDALNNYKLKPEKKENEDYSREEKLEIPGIASMFRDDPKLHKELLEAMNECNTNYQFLLYAQRHRPKNHLVCLYSSVAWACITGSAIILYSILCMGILRTEETKNFAPSTMKTVFVLIWFAGFCLIAVAFFALTAVIQISRFHPIFFDPKPEEEQKKE